VNDRQPVRVFFPCTGLGHERRGFETFARECAVAMRSEPQVDLTVFGGGDTLEANERKIWNLPRASRAARIIASVAGRDPYFIEQGTFFAGFLPILMRGAPDVVYFGDLNFGNACWHWRRISGQRFRMLYFNGGPTTRPFTRCDVVQQVSPEHLASALARGESPERQILLPHGLTIEQHWHSPSHDERRRIRLSLGVPPDGQLVLSVGALNGSHKRMDYVIREVAALSEPRPHLLLLGTCGTETESIRALGTALLGPGGCTMRTVEHAAVLEAYRAADVFVLASIVEGFGLAHVEALSAGVPCVAHDSSTTEYIYGALARRADLSIVGALTPLLVDALSAPRDDGVAHAQHDAAYNRFSWTMLAPHYARMFREVADRGGVKVSDGIS
jgi:1,2-diacylglycerol 3-alpha-glucosyltransferase